MMRYNDRIGKYAIIGMRAGGEGERKKSKPVDCRLQKPESGSTIFAYHLVFDGEQE